MLQEIESVGFQLGQKATDKLANDHTTKERDMLELIRFFFNNVWQYVFGGSMPENLAILKNKKCDVFEVTDNEFRFLARISPEYDSW